jgi:hypothetical protein
MSRFLTLGRCSGTEKGWESIGELLIGNLVPTRLGILLSVGLSMIQEAHFSL